MRTEIFFGEIIFLTNESFMEFLIAGYLNAKHPLFTTDGEIAADCTAVYLLLMSFVVGPIVWIYILCQRIEKINEPSFEEKWGALYHAVRTTNKVNVSYFLIYCFRRFIFCYTAFLLS